MFGLDNNANNTSAAPAGTEQPMTSGLTGQDLSAVGTSVQPPTPVATVTPDPTQPFTPPPSPLASPVAPAPAAEAAATESVTTVPAESTVPPLPSDSTASATMITPPSVLTDGSLLPNASTLASTPAASEDLLAIKQDALHSLAPLVEHIDQTPEERFKTIMMMIQAADDKTLIKQAYDAASSIPDDKAKAQALLDVVNEINYFTQKDNPPAA